MYKTRPILAANATSHNPANNIQHLVFTSNHPADLQ